MAFAIFEERRMDWRRHHLRVTGRLPTSTEVTVWYASQPPLALTSVIALAEKALEDIGQCAVQTFQGRRRQFLDGQVLLQLHRMARWRPQFAFNVLGGVVGSLVYTMLLVVMGFLVLNEPSAQDFSRQLMQQKEPRDEIRILEP